MVSNSSPSGGQDLLLSDPELINSTKLLGLAPALTAGDPGAGEMWGKAVVADVRERRQGGAGEGLEAER